MSTRKRRKVDSTRAVATGSDVDEKGLSSKPLLGARDVDLAVDNDEVDTRHIKCNVCLQLLKEPHEVQPCSHVFCRSCILEWVSLKKECPTCRGPLDVDRIAPNYFVERRLLGPLEVRCRAAPRGCKWTGSYVRLEDHWRACRFDTSICDDCNQSVRTPNLESHREEECLERVIECPVPGCTDHYRRACEADHQEEKAAIHVGLLTAEVKRMSEDLREIRGKTNTLQRVTLAVTATAPVTTTQDIVFKRWTIPPPQGSITTTHVGPFEWQTHVDPHREGEHLSVFCCPTAPPPESHVTSIAARYEVSVLVEDQLLKTREFNFTFGPNWNATGASQFVALSALPFGSKVTFRTKVSLNPKVERVLEDWPFEGPNAPEPPP